MKRIRDERILKVVKDYSNWIKKMCSTAELDRAKKQELYQEVLFNLHMVSDKFDERKILNPVGWVKAVTTNVTNKHTGKECERKKGWEKYEKKEKGKQEKIMYPTVDLKADLQSALKYIHETCGLQDYTILNLYLMKETNKDIAEIVGMKPGSIANRIMFLKEKLKDFLAKGGRYEQ